MYVFVMLACTCIYYMYVVLCPCIQNLDVTVALYNQVRESILDVEYPLIETQLVDIDTQLEKAISQLNWTSEGTRHVHVY